VKSHDLERLLDFDPRQAAQESGAANPEKLADVLAKDHHWRLRALLTEFEDSYLGQPFRAFLLLCNELDFHLLQSETFWNGDQARFVVLHRDGMLICADSYQGMVNQARLLVRSASWLPSGQQHGRLWRADLDVRQGLKVRLAALTDQRPINLQTDCQLLPEQLASRLKPAHWPLKARRSVGVNKRTHAGLVRRLRLLSATPA